MNNRPQWRLHKERIPLLLSILLSIVVGAFIYAYGVVYSPSSGLAWVGFILLVLGCVLTIALSRLIKKSGE